MWARATSAKTPGKEPERLLPARIRRVREVFGRLGRRNVQHALGAADHDHVGNAGRDLHRGVAERGVRGRARRLEAGGGNGGDAEHGGGLRPGVELLLGLAADHVAVIERLDRARSQLGVDQRVPGRLGEQLGRRAVVLAELRDPDANHRHTAHKPSRGNVFVTIVMIASIGMTSGLVVLGCGWIAQRHAAAARRLRLPLVFASRDPARARTFARRYGFVAAYADYGDAVRDERADAVIVCTPHDRHLADVRLALDAGKHVLVEKPIARTLGETDEMIAAAAAAGRVLMVAEQFHFMPAFRYVHALIERGRLGALRELHFVARGFARRRGWRLDRDRAGGGALIGGGIHYIHNLRWWGGPV